MDKHTPAPWSVIPAREYEGDDDSLTGSYASPASIEGADGNPVCEFGTLEGSGCLYENEADYHLIAAAPEMLEALYQYVSDLRFPPVGDSIERRIARAEAVIAKARGGE